MPKVPLSFVGQAYNMPATQLDAQTCINYYLTQDPTGKYTTALLPRPGLEVYIEDDGESEVRGMYAENNVLYAVIDSTLYLCYSNRTRKSVGTLKTSTGLVYMLSNGFQIFISDRQYGYVYQIKKSESREAGDFFVIVNASSNIDQPTFQGSGLDDMTTSGTYTGDTSKQFLVAIDSAGTPDTFKWSDDNGDTYKATNVPITLDAIDLEDGVEVNFLFTTGHTEGDYWTFDVTIDSAFYVPVIPAYQDSYGIYPRQNSDRFYISGSFDFSQVNALDFAASNVAADNLVASLSIHQEVWLFGEETIEIWYDTGAPDFPFERRTNMVLNYGCAAPYSVQNSENNIIFLLGRNQDGGRIILRISNYNAEIISTEPLNQELRSYTTVSDAFGMTLERNGHVFYIITFPTEDKTWVYDMSMEAWYEWKSELDNPFPYSNPTRQGRWIPNNHVVFDGENLVGDFQSGKIYRLTEDKFTDNNKTITYERTCRHSSQNNQYLEVNSLEIDVERGEGLVDGQGEDPKFMLQISKDGGKSWGSELWRSGGKIGEFRKRLLFYRLGTARVFTFRMRVTDPIYNVILGAILDIGVFD